MKYPALSLLVLASSLVAPICHAQFVTGQRIVEWADADDRLVQGRGSPKDSAQSSQLLGYVMGVVDSSRRARYFCLPENAQLGQISAVIIKFVRAHPEFWDGSADALSRTALGEAFPCRK